MAAGRPAVLPRQPKTTVYSSEDVCIIHAIGVGRFRILGGGARSSILGGQGGQIPSRHMMSY